MVVQGLHADPLEAAGVKGEMRYRPLVRVSQRLLIRRQQVAGVVFVDPASTHAISSYP